MLHRNDVQVKSFVFISQFMITIICMLKIYTQIQLIKREKEKD